MCASLGVQINLSYIFLSIKITERTKLKNITKPCIITHTITEQGKLSYLEQTSEEINKKYRKTIWTIR